MPLHRTIRYDESIHQHFYANWGKVKQKLGSVRIILFNMERYLIEKTSIGELSHKTLADVHYKESKGKCKLSPCNKTGLCTSPTAGKSFSPEGISLFESHENMDAFLQNDFQTSTDEGDKAASEIINHMRSVFEKKFPTAEKIPKNWTEEEISGKKYSRFLCYQLTTTNLTNDYMLYKDINKTGHWILYSQDEKDLYKIDKLNAYIEPNVGTLFSWIPCGIMLKANAEHNWKHRRNDDSNVDVYIETLIEALYFYNSTAPFLEDMDTTDQLITKVATECNVLKDLQKLNPSTSFYLSHVVKKYQDHLMEEDEDSVEDTKIKRKNLIDILEQINIFLIKAFNLMTNHTEKPLDNFEKISQLNKDNFNRYGELPRM